MKSSKITHQEVESPNANATEGFVRGRLTWLSYWMLGYFAFLEAVLGPLMPFMRGDLRLSYTLASLHFSAFALGSVVIGTIADRLTAWRGRSVSFWGGGFGMAAGTLLVALSPVAVGTIAGAFLMGLLGGLLLITIQAVLADRHRRWSPVALTEANVVASGFALLAPVTVGLVTGAGLVWRVALLPSIVFLLIIATVYRSVPLPRPEKALAHHAETSSRKARLPLAYWAFWCLIALATGVEWCVGYWGASFLATNTAFSKADAAAAMGAFFLAMLVGRYTGSRLSRVLPAPAILVTALVVALLGFPLFWLPPLPPVRVVGLFIVGLGLANVYPLGVALGTAAAPGQTDRASARLAIAGGGSVFLAPLILGALADHVGIGSAFGIVVPMLLLALLAAGLAGRAHVRASVSARAS